MLYLFESELRSKCDYKGTLPYWDMGLDNTADGFAKSPVFDNVYGVGGNGPYIEDVTDPDKFPVQKPIEIPERSGGGKFSLILRRIPANVMVQVASKRVHSLILLFPWASVHSSYCLQRSSHFATVDSADYVFHTGYSVDYTPHCLRRDFSLPIITSALSDEVINQTLSATSFDEFNLHIQGYSMQVSGMTLHAGMHLGIGGAVGDVCPTPPVLKVLQVIF